MYCIKYFNLPIFTVLRTFPELLPDEILNIVKTEQNGKTLLFNKLYSFNDKPAEIWYYEDEKVEKEIWWKNSKAHRDNDKPAVIWYYEDGNIKKRSLV